jgi:hypothetical protein
VSLILGKKGNGPMTAQSYRFDKDKFTAAEARKWLKDHDVKPMSFEAASEKEATLENDAPVDLPELKEKCGEMATMVSYIPGTAVSFAEVEEYLKSAEVTDRVKELTRQFQTISSNIMWSPDLEDKPGALRALVDELDTLLTEAVNKEAGLLGKAKEKVLKALGLQPKMVAVEASKARLMVWKENGQYRWLAVYSNKYRDEDNPPEILSAQAHKEFVAAVDSGQALYPELWHYHVPGTRWGVSDFVAFDEGSGFSLASGTVDKGHETEAEVMAELDHPLAVSHGLEVLERDSKDTTVIEKYRTVEISDLPLAAAANKLTGFSILKGASTMTLSADKKAHLQKVGLKPEAIAALEADLDAKAKAAETAGIESKEATTETKPEVERKDETIVAPSPVAPTTPAYATRAEVAEAITASIGPLMEQMTALSGAMTKMAKTDEERITKIAADTPALSIAAMVMKNLSTIGKIETKIGVGDMLLAKDKPAEVAAPSRTGIPFLDTMLAAEVKPL